MLLIFSRKSYFDGRKYAPQYPSPTKTTPPIVLPIVTGSRFLIKKADQVRVLISTPSGVIPAHLVRMIPAGMKYILATQCSKPIVGFFYYRTIQQVSSDQH